MTRLHPRRMRKHDKISAKLFDLLIRIIPIALIVWFIWAQNNQLITKEYIYTAADLPKSFVGYNIVHISDICNSNINIEKAVKKAEPNIIVVSGGYSDSTGNSGATANVINRLSNIAPVYYIYNYEDAGNELSNTSANNLVDLSVELLPENKDVTTFIKDNYGEDIIEQANEGNEEAQAYIQYVTEALTETANQTITLAGLSNYNIDDGAYEAYLKTIELIGTDANKLSILLNGNVKNLDEICVSDTDMIFMGGTFGTNFISSEYKKGIYGNHGTQIFVSGGVGKHDGVFRVMNFPEIQCITLSDGTIRDINPLEKFIGKFLPDVGNIFENDGGFSQYTQYYGNMDLEAK